MAINWQQRPQARDQHPQQLSSASQEALHAMKQVYDVCPEEEKSLIRNAFNEYCAGATREPDNLGPRGSQRLDDLGAEDAAYTVRRITRIALDAVGKVRQLSPAPSGKVPTFNETYPDAGKIKIQW